MKPVKAGRLLLGDGTPKICIPLVGTDQEEICKEAETMQKSAPDLFEWRVDFFAQNEDQKALAETLTWLYLYRREVPLLFTYRSQQEGGRGTDSAETYEELLRWIVTQEGIDLLDVEGYRSDIDAARLIEEAKKRGIVTIASAHFFSRTPKDAELDHIAERLEKTGGDLLKIACMPFQKQDVLRLMAWTERKCREMERPLITMSMGDIGRLSRISGKQTGSAITFARGMTESAPGQMTISEMRSLLASL